MKDCLTRREIIALWNTQEDEILDKYSCPDCRDILARDSDKLLCVNYQCSNDNIYNLQGERTK